MTGANPAALIATPFLIAFLLVVLSGAPVIAQLAKRKASQPISPDAPEKHRLKHGTPTMGGLLILGAVMLSVFGLYAGFGNFLVAERGPRLFAVLLTFLCAGLIGILDDVGKARKKENKAGLSERAKLTLQIVVAAGFVAFLAYLHRAPGHSPLVEGTTSLYVAGRAFDLGLFYYPLALLFLVFFGNATNFTDGLDGLATGVTLIAALALGGLVGYVGLEMGVFYGALAGACAGFLWFNAYPARVFMGDTGSLALGMGLAAAALAAKQELLLLLVGAVYVAEIASMMIQRYVFKYRRIRHGIEYAKANRVFRRAPLHHHFEELGMHETQVVGRFWASALAAAALGFLAAPLVAPTVAPEQVRPAPGVGPTEVGTP